MEKRFVWHCCPKENMARTLVQMLLHHVRVVAFATSLHPRAPECVFTALCSYCTKDKEIKNKLK